MFRLTNPDGELPPVPTALTRYLDPPRELVESAVEAKEAAVEAFKVLVGKLFPLDSKILSETKLLSNLNSSS